MVPAHQGFYAGDAPCSQDDDRLVLDVEGVRIDAAKVVTNIVSFEIDAAWMDAGAFQKACAERGLRFSRYLGTSPRLRAVTRTVLREIGADAVPSQLLFNKVDRLDAADVALHPGKILQGSRSGNQAQTIYIVTIFHLHHTGDQFGRGKSEPDTQTCQRKGFGEGPQHDQIGNALNQRNSR